MGNRRQDGGRNYRPPKLTYLVPRDTANMLQSGDISQRCTNLGLILARYIPQEVIENSDVPGERFLKWRHHWLDKITERFRLDTKGDWQGVADAYLQRWLATTENSQSFEGVLQDRMVIGLGSGTVLETGFTLHHVTGLPFVPGSALKGLARAYALFSIAADLGVPVLDGDALNDYLKAIERKKTPPPTPLMLLEDVLDLDHPDEVKSGEQEELAQSIQKLLDELNHHPQMTHTLTMGQINAHEAAQHFRRAFGSQTAAGCCVFHEAVMSKPPAYRLFDVDVMTPHYPDYYSDPKKKTPPSDDQSPIPLEFLTVAADTRFVFAVGLRAACLHKKEAVEARKQAVKWLRRGLSEFGIGSKTHSGYGLFTISK